MSEVPTSQKDEDSINIRPARCFRSSGSEAFVFCILPESRNAEGDLGLSDVLQTTYCVHLFFLQQLIVSLIVNNTESLS